MAARRKRGEKPAQSNRGRPGARGVFVIFDRDAAEEKRQRGDRAADRPLSRDDGDRAA